MSLNSSVSNLCDPCFRKIPLWNSEQCAICEGFHRVCPHHSIPNLRHFDCGFYYKNSIQELITGLKYRRDFLCGEILVRATHAILKDRLPDIKSYDTIIPVPSTRKKIYLHGYNSAAWLAKKIFREKIKPNSVHKTTEIPNLASLNRIERQKQMQQKVFQVQENFQGKNILVFDDVLTTGSTLKALTQEISNHGVQTISVFVLARNTLRN